MPLYPLWPMLGLLALAYVFYASAFDPDVGRPSLIANAAKRVATALQTTSTIKASFSPA
jgi:hypothetical protein